MVKQQEAIPRQIWIFFSSVRLTIYILVLLATTAIIGTVLLQNGTPQQYKELYGPGACNLIRVFTLDDMYHSWWFLTLLLLLCINITVCSVERLSMTWNIIFPKKMIFSPARFLKSRTLQTITVPGTPEAVARSVESLLIRQGTRVQQKQENGTLMFYGEKRRWTRIGVYVVHASVLLMLLGALIGSVFGFKASVRLDEGAQTSRVFHSKTRQAIPLAFAVRCNEFEVRFYDTGAPEEFRSSLTIIEDGTETLTTDIRVNHPLRYKGINIFQSSYGTASPDAADFSILDTVTGEELHQRIQVGESIDLPDNQGTFQFQGYLPHFEFRGHDLGEAFFGKLDLAGEDGFQIGLPMRFPTFDKMRKGRFVFTVTDFEKRYYTGLQVTRDPGVWYVYAGFVLMILGCWITFFMAHQGYFFAVHQTGEDGCTVHLAGTSNRNPHSLKLTLTRMAAQLKENTTP